MTPNARIAAAIGVLDQVLAGAPAEQALLRWSRGARFAGSGDRAAVRDLVFDGLRRLRSRAAAGGGMSGRGLMIGRLREEGTDPAAVFTGQGHDPAPLAPDEGQGHSPVTPGEAFDLPDWLWASWSDSLGKDAEAVAALMRDRAPVWLRVNLRKAATDAARAALAAEGIETEPSPALESALRVLSNERRVAASRAYAEGLVELQDLSPQLACAALPLASGARVLDYCAGGGGKALALAARADLQLSAHDADPARMRDLPARAARAGVRITPVATPKGHHDLVIADVPCSGSGTWRRTPDQKWRLTPAILDELRTRQAGILAEAADRVAAGGHLAYMTCSLLRAENEDQIARFLATHPRFAPVSQQRWTPIEAGDGFFLSLLRHEGGDRD